MNRGDPPTERNALTGEFTPPGMVWQARSNSSVLRDMVFGLEAGVMGNLG
jgi:hypothetical protein